MVAIIFIPAVVTNIRNLAGELIVSIVGVGISFSLVVGYFYNISIGIIAVD